MLWRKVLCFAVGIISVIALHAQRGATIAGYVEDASTGEPVIGAAVIAKGRGTSTGNDGRYSLTIPCGTCEIVFSFVGFPDYRMDLFVSRDTVLNVKLAPGESLEQVVITADRNRGFVPSMPDATVLPLWMMDRSPFVLGEPDLIKSMQMLPGVQEGMEGLSGIYVRGGGADETFFVLDGVPMYGISHALGLFSSFTPDAVRKTTIYKGWFPVDYGGRVSGIVDIRTNDGNTQELRGKLRVGLINDAIHFDGPLLSERTSFSLSARTAHTLLAQPVISIFGSGLSYWFYDMNGKIVHRFVGGDKLFVGFYKGGDNFYHSSQEHTYKVEGDRITSHDEEKTKWGNTVVSVRWKHIFGAALYSDIILAYNEYSMNSSTESFSWNRGGQGNTTMRGWGSGIADFRSNAVFRYTLRDHKFVVGAEAVHHNFRPRTEAALNVFADSRRYVGEKSYEGFESAIFVGDDFRVRNRLLFSAGLRYSFMQTEGCWYSIPEPRLTVRLSINEDCCFHVSCSGASQYVHLLSSSDAVMPTDMYVPITEKLKPVISKQLSVGGKYSGLSYMAFSLESYWKKTANVLEYMDGMSPLSGSEGWESLVAMGEGKAYGVEFSTDILLKRMNLSLAYTWSRSWRCFPGQDVNNGEWFPYRYDRPHDFTIVAAYNLSPSLSLNASWVLRSGTVVTLAERPTYLIAPIMEQEFELIARRNNYRLPPTHRLNVSVSWERHYKRGVGEWQFSVYNLYNAMNPNLVYSAEKINRLDDGSYSFRRSYVKTTYLPILPSISYSYSF